ncbi:MAG: hypothetical protein Q8M02_14230 [Candidatus Didemnitutus sp.]|nr:hypothetical protein [Candidatus Didemnitutus sp.]
MSLINDALKKAQRERGQPADPAAMPIKLVLAQTQPVAAEVAAAKRKLAPIIGGIAGVLVLSGGALYFALRPSSPAPAHAPLRAPAVGSTATTRPNSPASTTASNPTAFVVPLTQPGETPPEVPAKAEPAAIVAEPLPAPLAPVLPPAPVTVPKKAGLTEAQFVTLVEALRVAGIRAGGNESRVLMNDRVFRLGDLVDHTNGIRLVGATANTLTFEDETGATYTRKF